MISSLNLFCAHHMYSNCSYNEINHLNCSVTLKISLLNIFPRSEKITFFAFQFQTQNRTDGLYTSLFEPLLLNPCHKYYRFHIPSPLKHILRITTLTYWTFSLKDIRAVTFILFPTMLTF